MPRHSAKPTTVVFVRHGETTTTGKVLPGRAPGLHLSDHGRRQAEAVAEALATSRAAAVYASPMERTRETAAPIAKALSLRTRTDSGLLECEFGEWTGRRLSDLRRRSGWKTVQRHPSGWRFPGGESFAEMQVRITEAVRRLATRHPGETIVCVSHADPIKAAVADALGVHLDLFQRIHVAPCSRTTVSYGSEGPFVWAVNTGVEVARS